MFSRLFKRVSRAGAFVLGMVLILALGVLAAVLWQVNLTSSVEIIGPDMLVQEQYTDDDGIANLAGWDNEDDGTSDPAASGINVARTVTNIQTCTIVHDGGNGFTFSATKSYQDAYCNVHLKLANESPDFDMRYADLSTTMTDVEVLPITALGLLFVGQAGGQSVDFTVHVEASAVPAIASGTITLDFVAE